MKAAKFISLVDVSGGASACWPWTAGKNVDGYGVAWWEGRATGTHRIAWELANTQKIPKGLHVLHRCDNPPCCNPGHLFLGTQTDNNLDRHKKGRDEIPRVSGDRHGSVTHPECIARGERNGQSKLTEQEVAHIRSIYDGGQVTQRALAARLGVRQPTINRLLRGHSWSNTQADDPETRSMS